MRFLSSSVLSVALMVASSTVASPLQARDDPVLPTQATVFVRNQAGDAIAYATENGRFLPLPDPNETSRITVYDVVQPFVLPPEQHLGLRAVLQPQVNGAAGVCDLNFPADNLVCGADKPEGDDGNQSFVFIPTFVDGIWVLESQNGFTLVDDVADGEAILRVHSLNDNEPVIGEKVNLTLSEVSIFK